jgi:single-strand DNA-binding protein
MSGSSVNKVILVGNLGHDPEVRTSQAGKKIVSFSIATSDSWKDKEGERQEKTYWHKIVIFNEGLAIIAEDYLKKGSLVYIEGALQTRDYEKDGLKKYITEVVLQGFGATLKMLDSRNNSSSPSAPEADFVTYGNEENRTKHLTKSFDDEIPF